MAVDASGMTVDGDSWELSVAGDCADLYTMVTVTCADGSRWGGGAGGPALYQGRRVNAYTASADSGPRLLVARVATEVRAVVATLSDGTREDLVLHGDPRRLGCRVAVLVYPRRLDIHRLDLLDATGHELADRI